MKFQSKYKMFHYRKCIWKYCLRNGGHFVQGEMSQTDLLWCLHSQTKTMGLAFGRFNRFLKDEEKHRAIAGGTVVYISKLHDKYSRHCWYRAGGGLVVSHQRPGFGPRTSQLPYRGTVCVPGPTQADTGIAGVRKWDTRPVMTLVH